MTNLGSMWKNWGGGVKLCTILQVKESPVSREKTRSSIMIKVRFKFLLISTAVIMCTCKRILTHWLHVLHSFFSLFIFSFLCCCFFFFLSLDFLCHFSFMFNLQNQGPRTSLVSVFPRHNATVFYFTVLLPSDIK